MTSAFRNAPVKAMLKFEVLAPKKTKQKQTFHFKTKKYLKSLYNNLKNYHEVGIGSMNHLCIVMFLINPLLGINDRSAYYSHRGF